MKLFYDEMVELAELKKEFNRKVEQVGNHEVEIFTYAVAMTDTFDSDLAKWFRGTVFDADSKECICRPFPKFFNLNENEQSKPESVDWDSALYFHKMDGSLVMPVLLPDGNIRWKSKSTFHSAHATKANHLFDEMSEAEREAIVSMLEKGYTPLFELVSNDPEFRIVVEYDWERLVFLGNINIETGVFMPGLTAVDGVSREDAYGLEGIEGFVVYDGKKMVKIKTEWYLTRHRAVWGTTKKSVVEATLAESIDDVIGIVAGLGMEDLLADIEVWRDETNWELIALQEYIDDVYALLKKELGEEYTRKDFAMKLLVNIKPEYRKFFFALEDGKSIEEMKKVFVKELLLNKEDTDA